MNKDSDISNTFHAAHTIKDLSWVDEVKKEKEKWKDYYDEYWYKDNLEYTEHLKKLIEDRDNEIKMYKDSYHNVLNLARGLRTLQRDGIEVLESLEKK
jgi:predicted methyltransferase